MMVLTTLVIFGVVCVLSSFFFWGGRHINEGGSCINSDSNDVILGRYLSVYQCPWALQRIQTGQRISTYNFFGITPIVCCPVSQIVEKDEKVLDSTLNPEETSTDNNITARDSFREANRDENYGILSKAKCEEYYPIPKGFAPFATGAQHSLAEEFPHMAALGFGEPEDIQWKCGGSLISLQHVLTAAHCLYSRDFGYVKYVRLGDLNIAIDTDPAEPQDFTVNRTTYHPSYDSQTLKNDIAVIELDRPVRLTKYVKPACLNVNDKIDTNFPITASGWGITEFAGSPSNHLLKVSLKIVDKSNCLRQYARVGGRGQIDDAIQVCAGSADEKKIMDTCQGDSGGPLQYRNNTNAKHYYIIGITSFGKACGISNSAGIYTRVSYHVPWIESLVFKTQS